jgi:hypothetical protein
MLVVWAALIGLALPAVACTASSSLDCCPTGSAQHCPGVPTPTKADSANTCCTFAPALARIAAVPVDRVRQKAHAPSDLPDLIARVAWTQSDQTWRPAAGPIQSLASSYWHDASLTYLRTARLRI